MRLLIAVDKTRFFYMNQFANALKLKGVNYQIIDDLDIYGNSKFGKKYLRWITTPKKIVCTRMYYNASRRTKLHPFAVKRNSGSRVRLPINKTLLKLAISSTPLGLRLQAR